jgi:F1F0 ATPase subunit 2
MMAIDWTMLGLGALAGALASALFFAGLAWGMRLALRSRRPMPVLLLSGAIRISALLAVGWLVAEQGAASLAGFALAFLVVRVGIIAFARPRSAHEAA